MWRLISCSLLIAAMAGYALPADAAKRVALVIGNGAYRHAEPLPNPANDAEAVAAALRRLGFVVIEAVDQDRAGMQGLLRQFSAELAGADASLFFYAGHGLQVERRNYLLPVDATLQSDVDLPFEAVAVDFVLDLMEQSTPLRLVFLDACRDNPLAGRLARSAPPSRSLGVGRGLARMNSGVGTLIAFAAEPDQVALDGEGGHSPFTQALLEHIETPGLEIRHMLSRVRVAVIESTKGRQLPLDTSALVDEFYFAPAARAEPPAPEPEPALAAPAGPAAAAASAGQAEYLFWQSVQNSGDANDLRAYLERFPDGLFAQLARNRLNALSAAPQVAALTPPAQPQAPRVAETIEVDPIDLTMVATRNANLRGAPDTDDDPLGVLAQGTEVAVVGKVIGADWYRIRRPDGGRAYVYAPLLAALEPPALPSPEPVPTLPADHLARAEPAQAAEDRAPAAPPAVQTVAVAPNVAGSARAPLADAEPAPAPQLDTAALLETLGERVPGNSFSLQSTGTWGDDRQTTAFDRWADVGPSDDAPRLLADDGAEVRVQTSSDTFGQAVMTTHVTPETFGVLLDTRTTRKYRFMRASVSGARSQWAFLNRHGARETGTSSLVLDGVALEVAALRLRDGAPAESCLAFVGYHLSRRVDGFLCRAAGPVLELAQASAVLGQIRVPWFIDP